MEKTDNLTYFRKFVSEDNHLNIKSELSNFILLFDGNKAEIDKAINYARDNSTFVFENHIPSTPSIPLLTDGDKFIYENRQLVSNFSEERLVEVLRLYQIVYPAEENNSKSAQFEEERKVEKDEKDNTLKNVAIVAGVAITGYLLYQLLK